MRFSNQATPKAALQTGLFRWMEFKGGKKESGAYGTRNRKLWQTRPKCFEARQGLPILVP
jgi:hypothetical protein